MEGGRGLKGTKIEKELLNEETDKYNGNAREYLLCHTL